MKRLRDVAVVHDNMALADFWFVDSGPNIGMPVDQFRREYIGVMFKADAVLKSKLCPRSFWMYFNVMYRVAGVLAEQTITVPAGVKLSAAKLRRLILPSGTIGHETHA